MPDTPTSVVHSTRLKLLDSKLISSLSAQARGKPRGRTNYNLHANTTDAVQRLLNAIEPGSYIPPHRHLLNEKEETLVAVAGRLGVICFNDIGAATWKGVLEASTSLIGIHIPLSVWHTVVALEPGTVILECKGGPYIPLRPEDIAPWAPAPKHTRAALRAWEALLRS